MWPIGFLVPGKLRRGSMLPEDSDIDLLSLVMMHSGHLIPRHHDLFCKNPVFAGVRLPEIKETEPLERRYPKLSEVVIDLAKVMLLFFLF